MNEIRSTVKIVGHTDCGEAICAAGGRISTLSGNATEILEKSGDPQKNAALIGKVTASGHTSVIEHISFNLAFTNVSVLVEQFMIEFRLASFTVKSRRYVDFSDAGFFTPEIADAQEREKFIRVMRERFDDYAHLAELGIPKEDARFVLPYCFYSNFLCTLNGRELYHVLETMLFGRGAAYPEIKKLGEELLAQASEIAPGVFGGFLNCRHTVCDVPVAVPAGIADARTDVKQARTELLAATPDPEQIVARTALIETGLCSASEIERLIADKEIVKQILASVVESDRPRALENVSFTFRINGLSLSGITHLVRHRMQSVQIPPLKSGRPEAYIIPPSVQANAQALEIYTQAFRRAADYHRSAPEEVRAYALLSGNTLDVVTTMNARELLLFLRLRTCNRAQWEIRAYAVEMLMGLRVAAPLLFSHYGPSCCVMDHCPEGRLTCGKIQEVRQKFRGDDR